MYLFARSARLAPGNLEKSMSWAALMTEKVNQVAEFDARLWTTVFSAGVGTLVWTARVEELAVLESNEAKLMADSGYLSLVDDGAKLLSDDPINDALVQYLYADPGAAESPAQYVSTVQGLLAPGNMARGVELGVEIAQKASTASGCPTSFGMLMSGPYGAVEWITLYGSIEQFEQGQQALAQDADFAKFIDGEASTAFQPNPEQTIYRRVV